MRLEKSVGRSGSLYTGKARIVLEIMGLGQRIKRRTFGPTEQEDVWENEKRRAWGGTKERLEQGGIKDVTEEGRQKSTGCPCPKQRNLTVIFAVSNACKTLLQFPHPDLVHLESYSLLTLCNTWFVQWKMFAWRMFLLVISS